MVHFRHVAGTEVVLKRLRIAALLYLLLFVVGAQFFTARHMTDWDAPIWVDIYTIAGDDDPGTRRFIDNLSDDEFAAAKRKLLA